MRKITAIILFLLTAAGFGYTDELNDQLEQHGFSTPDGELKSIDFELLNLEGVKEKLSDYEGQVVFLNFWATWCPPCRGEMPSMEKLYNELKNEGFIILAVDLGDGTADVQDFVDDYDLSFPVLLDQTGEIGGIYNASSIPTTYIIDRKGNIIAKAVGGREWDEDTYINLFRDILSM